MESEQIMKIIGARIKERRAELGLSQDELAKKINRPKQFISRYENFKVTNPTLKNLCEVAEALGVQLWELIRPTEEEKALLLDTPGGLKEFQEFISSKGINLKEEELKFLGQLKITGSAPQVKEVYMLFWLMLRGLSSKELDKLIK